MTTCFVKKVDPISAANVVALALAGVTVFFLLIAALGVGVGSLFGSRSSVFGATGKEWLFFCVLPVFYGIFAWFATAVGAKFFNMASGFTGGVKIELETVSSQSTFESGSASANAAAPACPVCGVQFNPSDYRPDVSEPLCSSCGASLNFERDGLTLGSQPRGTEIL